MKTAGRENPNRWATKPNDRAHGAENQNRSCSKKWAAKQEKLQPLEWCFFLTSPFREQIRRYLLVARDTGENFAKVRWQPNGVDGLCFMREARSS